MAPPDPALARRIKVEAQQITQLVAEVRDHWQQLREAIADPEADPAAEIADRSAEVNYHLDRILHQLRLTQALFTD